MYKRGDILESGEKILFYSRELPTPGFCLGVLLEGFRGQPYQWSIERIDEYTLVAEEAGIDVIEQMEKHTNENPPPPLDKKKMKHLIADMRALGLDPDPGWEDD